MFTLEMSTTRVLYSKSCDHDKIEVKLKDFLLYDNTSYPDTLDPFKIYTSQDKLISNEIIGLNKDKHNYSDMLELEMTLFTYPGKEGSCCLQKSKDFNMHLDLRVCQIKIIYMMECYNRIIEYSLSRISKLLTSPSEEEEKQSAATAIGMHLFGKGLTSKFANKKDREFWEQFDLLQESQIPKMNMKIRSPLILLPDLRPDANHQFHVDLGTVTIQSELQYIKGRWNGLPEKPLKFMNILVNNKQLHIDMVNLETREPSPIIKEKEINIAICMPTGSPYLADPDAPGYKDPPKISGNRVFNQDLVDQSMTIFIKQKLLRLSFRQDVIQRLFDTLEHNILKNDQYTDHFNSLKLDEDEEIKERLVTSKFKGKVKTEGKKKTMCINVFASAFSIEFRDDDDILIMEMCFINLDFGMNSYQDGKSEIWMRANAFYIFHDEDPMSQLKEVMLGQKNSRSFAITDKNFYEVVPKEIEEANKKATGQINDFFTLDLTTDADGNTIQEITIHRVKILVRPQVFLDLSNFFISALSRLDYKKEQKIDPKKEEQKQIEQAKMDAISPKNKIIIRMTDSILCLRAKEQSKKALAVLIDDMEIHMESQDDKMIRRQIGSNFTRARPVSSMSINIGTLRPYLCKLIDLTSKPFGAIKRRVILNTSLTCNIDSKLKRKDRDTFNKFDTIEVQVGSAYLKTSLADTYTIMAIFTKMAEDGGKIGEAWSNFTAQNFNAEIVQNPDLSISTISAEVGDLDVTIIQDKRANFMPLLNLSASGIRYEAISREEEKSSDAFALVTANLYYFNPNCGYWEPGIETFTVGVFMGNHPDSRKDPETKQVLHTYTKNFMKVVTSSSAIKKFYEEGENENFPKVDPRWFPEQDQPIGMNISIPFMTVINTVNGLQAEANEVMEAWKKKQEEEVQRPQTMQIASNSDFVRGGTNLFSQKNTLRDDRGTNLLLFEEEAQENKIISPYAVRNLTNHPIKIFFYRSPEATDENMVVIGHQEKQDINFIMDESMKVSMSSTEPDKFVRVEFHKDNMRPVPKINLNSANLMKIHRAHNQKEVGREDFVIQTSLEKDQRVLTVRTQYVLHNKSEQSYQVRIFWYDKEKKKVHILSESHIAPEDIIPLPDYEEFTKTSGINGAVKIAIRPERTRKWSDEFKLQILKNSNKIIPNRNLPWDHGTNYSILKKMAQKVPGVFNFVLLPAMMVKNCLPIPISIEIAEAQDENPAWEQQIEHSHTGHTIIKKEACQLEKQEQKHLLNISNKANLLDIKIKLADNFDSTSLHLSPSQAEKMDLPIKIRDDQGRIFNIIGKIDTDAAGLRIVFFTENCLISHTETPLSFFYERRPGIFDEDNAHQFPNPVVAKVSGKDRTFVYLYDERGSIFTSLTAATDNFSGRIAVDTPGVSDRFQIKEDHNIFDFAYSTGIYQACPTEDVFTKVVEIAPLFILVNQTNKAIKFCQAHLKRQSDFHITMAPKERMPFHWEDRQKPLMAKFKATNLDTWSAAFTLDDCGSLSVQNLDFNKRQFFFKVTKRNELNSIFIIIEETQQPPYKIINTMQDITVQFNQINCDPNDPEHLAQRCDAKHEKAFAWTSFEQDQKIKCDFTFLGEKRLQPDFKQGKKSTGDKMKSLVKKNKSNKDRYPTEFSLDNLNESQQIHLVAKGLSYWIHVSVYTQGFSKVIEFGDKECEHIVKAVDRSKKGPKVEESKEDDLLIIDTHEEEKDEAEEGEAIIHTDEVFETLTVTEVLIQEINFSLILKNTELMTLYLRQTKCMLTQTENHYEVEFEMGRIQLDNTKDFEPLYPVIIKPKCPHKSKSLVVHDHLTGEGIPPFFQFYMNMRTNVPNVTYISMIEFLIQALEIKLEKTHLLFLIEYVIDLNACFGAGIVNTHSIFMAEEDSVNNFESLMLELEDTKRDTKVSVVQKSTWKTQVLESQGQAIYIQIYKGSPLLLEISMFKQHGIEESQRGAEVLGKLGGLGLKLTAFEGVPFQLNALEIRNIFGPSDVVTALLTAHYMSNIKANALRFVGSAHIFGDPLNFVNTLGSGVDEFFYEPREGFMQGPKAGLYGIIKGSNALITKSIGGVSGSVGKITGTIAKGMNLATGDQDYIQKKELEAVKNKPKSGFDGFGKGVKGFGYALYSGVTGIVSQPIKGAKEGGTKGFFKGVGKGVTGVVAKPIAGVVDVVAKTGEGIERTMEGQDCTQNNKRMRRSRPFYKDVCTFREYNAFEAQVYSGIDYKSLGGQLFYGVFKTGEEAKVSKATNEIDGPMVLFTEKVVIGITPILDKKENKKAKEEEFNALPDVKIGWVLQLDSMTSFKLQMGTTLSIYFKGGGVEVKHVQMANEQEANQAKTLLESLLTIYEFEKAQQS